MLIDGKSEAEEGFHACRVCGFENFKRFPFCSLCGAKIREHESQQRVISKKRAAVEREQVLSSDDDDIAMATTRRQQRARCGVARLFASGAFVWGWW